MIEINLVPDVKQELIHAQQVRSTVISFSIVISIIAAGVVALLAVYVFGVQAVRSNLADTEITKDANQLKGVSDLGKVLTIQNQLTKIDQLHDNSFVQSRVFDMLNSIIPPAPSSVTISDLVVSTDDGTVTLQGQSGATSSYTAVDTFKKTIAGANVSYTDSTGRTQQVPLASNLSTGDTSYGEDASGAQVLRFSLTFSYAPELLSPDSSNVRIVLTTTGNATDSYLGIPKSIFADRAQDEGSQ